MANKNQTVNVGREKGEIVYGGQYVKVAWMPGRRLLACPREVPESGQGDYLLNMISELRGVYDKVTRNGELGDIYVRALAVCGFVDHALTISKGGVVQIVPVGAFHEEAIKWANKVEMEAADGVVVLERGRYAVVAEGEGGVLRAYARPGSRLGPRDQMIRVIREVKRKFALLVGEWGGREVKVQGLMWRVGFAYRPVIRSGPAVGFELVNGDYVNLVKRSDIILYPRSVC